MSSNPIADADHARLEKRPPNADGGDAGDAGGSSNALPLPGEDPVPMPASNSELGHGPASGAGFSSAPPSPGFRPGDSPGPSRSHHSFTPLRPAGSSSSSSSRGALDRGTTPLLRADLGTHQRSSVRRSRPRGQLPPVSPAHPSLLAPGSVGKNLGRASGVPPSSPMRSPGPPSSSVIAATPLGSRYGGSYAPSSSIGADPQGNLLHNSVIPPSELDAPSQISQVGNTGGGGG